MPPACDRGLHVLTHPEARHDRRCQDLLLNGSFCKQRYKVPVACVWGSLFHLCHASPGCHQGSNLHSLVSRLAPLLCIAPLPSSSLSSLGAIAKYPNISVNDRRMKQRLELQGLQISLLNHAAGLNCNVYLETDG